MNTRTTATMPPMIGKWNRWSSLAVLCGGICIVGSAVGVKAKVVGGEVVGKKVGSEEVVEKVGEGPRVGITVVVEMLDWLVRVDVSTVDTDCFSILFVDRVNAFSNLLVVLESYLFQRRWGLAPTCAVKTSKAKI